ncbi:MAG: hypothetical protein HYS40_00855 [Gemmatimonadetes bacterium]|nr:hypothetical protein [Gemmatimonadota bacterium]
MRRLLSLLCVACAIPVAAWAQETPRRTVEFTGLVLLNAFYNTARVNNSDVPQTVLVDTLSVGGGGAAIRQTRLGVLLTDPDVLGGSFTGEVDVDFFGGQPPAGGRTFPVARLRRAVGTVSWRHAQLLIGQETPLVASREPRSLASVGFPDFAGAGNLWLWIPQSRVTLETGYTLRLTVQGAVLAPTAATPQATFFTQPDSAERTGRPYLQGRIRLGWGSTDDPSEIAVSGHQGWLRGLDTLSRDSLLTSQAITVDARIKVGAIELLGEGFLGKALAGLGGGGIGQNFSGGGAPVRTKGGWGQMNLKLRQAWLAGWGCGIDDPDDADVPANGMFQNFVCEVHLQWRPPGPMVFGFEYRRLQTRYQSGDFVASHLNAAAGFRF